MDDQDLEGEHILPIYAPSKQLRYSRFSKINASPQSRRGRREKSFCLSGDADKQKGFCSFIRRLTIGAIGIKGFNLLPEGLPTAGRDGVSAPIAARLRQGSGGRVKF